MLRKSLLVILCFICSTSAAADIVVFKRTTDIIKPVKGVDVEVWLADATNLILGPLNAEGSKIFDEQKQVEFMEKLPERIDNEQLKMLLLVSFVAKAKMELYGIQKLPTAIQMDRDGTVVRRIEGSQAIQEFLKWQ